ncbi:hypothetical protein CH294_10850 [Rhodococcus sp. 14-2483-1-1]|uniref:daptide-type RiPP biosynthesis methyltransferase n=1 Tax=Rhodococcus sp. 14-2483-1-1 TaxID=2023148 RepID=UPI000B9B81B3|nr:daptide-type RiPP biosynthesis methyltransferase [Rhodococcus sp. 14-2483-1-1]OZF36879.1 hypothetical protein CH294_10850 [Rhodococcus sp. 14-2483-1-1]
MTTAVGGALSELVESLGDRVRFGSLYDERGAEVYDALVSGDSGEVRELVSRVRSLPGPVLELAAGSGRLTLPLLATGRAVTALDSSEHMLEMLLKRLSTMGSRGRRCTVTQADMSNFSLGEQYGSIVCGTTSISLLDSAGRQGMYRSVHDHLGSGSFLVSTLDMLTERDTDEVSTTVTVPDGRVFRTFEQWSAGQSQRQVTVVPPFVEASHDPVPLCSSTVHILPADELEDELRAAGFVTVTRIALPDDGSRHLATLLEVRRA